MFIGGSVGRLQKAYDIDGIILLNGTSIQLPLTIADQWKKNGENLGALDTHISNVLAKVSFRLSNFASNIWSNKDVISQRIFIENELNKYSFDDLIKSSIPLNCSIPTLAIFSTHDELIPVNLSIKLLEYQCKEKIDLLVNEKAGHHTFEIGWEKYRCSELEKETYGEDATSVCNENSLAAKKNIESIESFLSRTIREKVH